MTLHRYRKACCPLFRLVVLSSLACIWLTVICGSALGEPSSIRVSSSAFLDGQEIPSQYTCEGANTSPPLQWKGVPSGTKSLALIMYDPDAPNGDFTHWIVSNIAPDVAGLPENVVQHSHDNPALVSGQNSFGRSGYSGPCPPPSQRHRYVFQLFALDSSPTVSPTIVSRAAFEAALDAHIIGKGDLIGYYRRSWEA